MRRSLVLYICSCASSAEVTVPTHQTQEAAVVRMPIRYDGRARWVVTEPSKDGWRRLAVIEWDERDDTLPTTLVDKVFPPDQTTAFTQAKYAYEHLQDSANGDARRAGFETLTDGAIWKATREWTPDDERAYGEWVASVQDSLLTGTGILVDCADFAVLLRWAYAHDHALPAANQLSGTGKLFGHWSVSTRWRDLPTDADWKKDRRFLAAFAYLRHHIFTHSLVKDLYPVALSREWVTPGSVHLSLRDVSGHTETVKHIAGPGPTNCPDGELCINTIWANEPAAEILYDTEIIEMIPKAQGKGGFMRWRWPYTSGGAWALKQGKNMPGYSLEQYQYAEYDTAAFQDVIYEKLTIELSPMAAARSTLFMLEDLLYQRLSVTEIGNLVCGYKPCAPSSQEYDDYSTPTRDGRIRAAHALLLKRIEKLEPGAFDPWLQSYQSPLFAGQEVTWYAYIMNASGILDRLSWDPNVPFLKRWGLSVTSAENDYRTSLFQFSAGWSERENQVRIGRDSTARLDTGLRGLSLHIRDLRLQVTPEEEAAVLSEYQGAIILSLKKCEWRAESWCELLDYALDEHGLLGKMSSDPRDSFEKRYGF